MWRKQMLRNMNWTDSLHVVFQGVDIHSCPLYWLTIKMSSSWAIRACFLFSFIFYPYQFPIFVSYCFVIWWSYDWKYDAHIAAHSDTTVARMLVGNKCDLENIRDISVDEGKSLAEAEGLFFMETSALDSTNVQKAFEIVIKEIYNNVSRKVLNSDSYKAELSVNRVSLVKDDSHGSKQASSCCSIWDLFCQGIHRCGWFALHPFVLWLVLYSPDKKIEIFYFTNSFFLGWFDL